MTTEPSEGSSIPPPNAERFAAFDRAKGILILLIVWGHNVVLSASFPSVRWFLYNWHVFGFLLITVLVPFNSRRQSFLTARIVRYFVPFAVFFTISWVAAAVIAGKWNHPSKSIGEWLLGLAIGSADLLDKASGARLYWFLPTLMGLTLIRYAIDRTGLWRNAVLVLVCLVGFLFAGMLPSSVKVYLPLGLPIALYALGPCLVFGLAMKIALDGSSARRRICLAACLAILIGATSYASAHNSLLTLANFNFKDVRSPDLLIDHASLAMAACAVIVLISFELKGLPWLGWLGRASLVIYLCHQLIFVPLYMTVKYMAPVWETHYAIGLGLALYATTLAVCVLIAAIFVHFTRLRMMILPRDMAEFRASFSPSLTASPSAVS